MIRISLIITGLLLGLNMLGQNTVSCLETDSNICIMRNQIKLITFNKSIVEAPEGKDSLYRRNGFIHPLKSPAGYTLTQIHPEGHEHHLGLWHPWTKTRYKGKEIDFWNLYRGEGYVRYAKTLLCNDNGFVVYMEHALRKEQEVILSDTFSVNVVESDTNYYVIDYKTVQTCVADSPITMQQYRYGGGLGLRLTKAWHNSEVEVLTSENSSRNNTDATSAKWLKLSGKFASGHMAGMVIIPRNTNFSYPEQIRLWGEEMYKGGDFMVNVSPTKKETLKMWPGKSYEFNYRLIIFDGAINAEQIANEMLKYNSEK